MRRLVAGLVLTMSCGGPTNHPDSTAGRAPTAPSGAGDLHVVETDEPGLTFKLGEGVEGAGKETPRPPAPATPLSDAAAAKVLARLPPLTDGAQKEFAMRERSQPAPRAGKTIEETFPPPAAPVVPDKTEAGPLALLRHMPDGAIPLAPRVSLTFSQPMVAVTSYAELEKLPVPVKLTPEPAGRWRWIGTKTVLFEPKGERERMPMATDYTVEVPAGTTSATGGKLAAAASFKFSTPPVSVTAMVPQDGPVRRDPLIFVRFDQKIDPSAVLPTIHVTAGGKSFATRLATSDEVRGDSAIASLVASAAAEGQPDCVMILRPTELLPVDTSVAVAVGPGTPSAEGPRKSDKAAEFGFRTYGAMRITQSSCKKGEECPPLSGFWVEFSNPIDGKKFSKDSVTIDPPLAGMKVVARGTEIFIAGKSKGRSKYVATFASSIPDVFGQTHERDEKVTFYTGTAGKALFATGGGFVVLDPNAGARASVYSVNQSALRVKVFAETPESWRDYAKFMREVWNREQWPPDPPGQKVIDETVQVKGEPDELTETSIDLAKALPSGKSGNIVLIVEPTVRPKNRWEWSPVNQWIQVTPIGLDAIVDNEKLIGWATSLKDGKPLEGAELVVKPTGVSAKTDGGGTARLPLGDKAGSMLVATWQGQSAFLPESTEYWSDNASWQLRSLGESYRWYVADDRQMYKPGEEVKLKGWIRKVSEGPQGDVQGWSGEASKLEWKLTDSRRNEIAKGDATINGLGGFDVSVKLPGTVNLGYTQFWLSASGAGQTSHMIQVQEFRRPEFEVGAVPSDGPYFVGGKATVTVSAKYYSGGGLMNADTSWNVSALPGSFTPPNRSDYLFGIEPTWFDAWENENRGGGGKNESFQAHTDSGGKHVLGIEFLAVNPPRPTNVVAQGTVMDVNRQAWTATANLLIHPASLYVGIKLDRPFLQHGEALKLDTIATDLDGKAVAGKKVHVRVVRLDWDDEDGQIKIKEVDAKECDVVSSDKAERCAIPTGEGGLYRITATIRDDQGRKNLTQGSVWVAGGKLPPQRGVAVENVRMVPDRKEYRAGDTAEILVVPPFYPAEAIMTLRRQGVFKTERFAIPGASYTLKVPIEDGWTPNVHVALDLVGQATRTNDSGEPDEKLGKRPAVGAGSVSLSIPPRSRELALDVKPRADKLEPGGETTLDLRLTDARGEPVANGEVAVVIVDEAVLSLTGYRLPDPLPQFYNYRDAGARDYHLRQNVLLARPEDVTTSTGRGMPRDGAPGGARAMKQSVMGALAPPSPAPMATLLAKPQAEAPPEPEQPQIKLRTDFNALALFAPAVKTDARGRAEVAVKLPDNLTRYRVMAIAVAGKRQFGNGESAITARLPIMVRPSPPRFLNFGDKLEMPVVLQNQTDSPVEIDVAMRAGNAELTAGAGRHVQVAANDRVEVRFPMAAVKAGTARFQFAAVATKNGKWADAAELEIPVWTPATTEAFATYGTIDKAGAAGAVSQPVKMPAGVFPQFGGIQVSTSSTALQALTDAVIYLVRYPYECSEQMSSRIIAIASLKDVLTAFQSEGVPAPDAMIASVKKDVDMLRRLQNGDGGWGFWKHGEESWPFLTAHVAHALARAKDKGFDVPKTMIDQALPYLRTIESHVPSWYSKEARQAIAGYALYVRARLGERDVAKAQRLVADAGGVEKLPLEAVAWIYPMLSGAQGADATVASIRKLVGNRIEETAGAAHFVTSYADGDYLLLRSDRRIDALFLEGLIVDQPKSDVIPKLVEGLLGHRKAGHWESTQEDGWVLVALDEYFNTYEKVTPDFVAKVWLGPAYAGDHAFKGRTTERANIDVPMAWLAKNAKDTQDLVLVKDGAGRLYYRIGMSYAPTDLAMPPRDNGFTVQRAYEPVDDPKDVTRTPDGTWHVKAGARVRVRVTMVVPTRRYHVALVDPIPAGLEPMNPALKTTGAIPQDPKEQKNQGAGWWYRGPWYEHQNLRDERVEAFASLVWEGVHEYSYVARATTPGTFVAPPPKAEEMYHPETFGRGASDKVMVE